MNSPPVPLPLPLQLPTLPPLLGDQLRERTYVALLAAHTDLAKRNQKTYEAWKASCRTLVTDMRTAADQGKQEFCTPPLRLERIPGEPRSTKVFLISRKLVFISRITEKIRTWCSLDRTIVIQSVQDCSDLNADPVWYFRLEWC